ncbi:MAG: TspO/MBR family protein [Sphingomonas sp.]
MAFLRWAVVTVPFILLLGFTSARSVPTGADNAWYQALVKPQYVPPDWAFPVAWTILYALMGVALALVINAHGSRLRTPALILFAAQLVPNLLWTPLFFGAHLVFWSLVTIAAMALLALLATALFIRVRLMAGLLMVPYLAWIGFAGYLTAEINRLNPNAATLVPSSVSSQIIASR